ncbi:MAG: hypothetical protein HUJ26_14310 [Planctomycetaceae bacterium]|nr:hypothetical protein [Planctomycetaceae bacterium]
MKWTGDLNDDCILRVGDWIAHVECLGEFDAILDGQMETLSYWYFSVYRGSEQIYHSGDAGGFITSPDQCREICETIINFGT